MIVKYIIFTILAFLAMLLIFSSIQNNINIDLFEGFKNSDKNPSFHILIATSGRKSIHKMLNSLKNELTKNDAITIVFDGENSKQKSKISSEWLNGHKAHINIIEQIPNLGYWGHGIRNKYQGILSPKCTFIMHADDDDIYIPGSFNKLRKLCIDKDTFYIAKMERIYKDHNKKKEIIPSINDPKLITLGNIGTPNFIVPTSIAPKGEWENIYGGDFSYYNSVHKLANNVVILDNVIYTVYKK